MNDLIGDSRTTYHPWQGLSQIPCFFCTDLRKASFLCAYLFIQALKQVSKKPREGKCFSGSGGVDSLTVKPSYSCMDLPRCHGGQPSLYTLVLNVVHVS